MFLTWDSSVLPALCNAYGGNTRRWVRLKAEFDVQSRGPKSVAGANAGTSIITGEF